MDRKIAEKAIPALFEAAAIMNNTLLLMQEGCSAEEFAALRRGTGCAMGYLHSDVIQPILREYPDLTPENMK